MSKQNDIGNLKADASLMFERGNLTEFICRYTYERMQNNTLLCCLGQVQ